MSGETVNTAVAKRDEERTIAGKVGDYQQDFQLVLPTHVKVEQFVRWCQGVVRRDENVAKVAQRNFGSLMAALLDCARLGLEPGETYHLVPFGNTIVGISDYKGLIELIFRAGAVSSVKVEVVRKNDLEPDPDDQTPDWPNGRPRFLWQPSEMDRPHHSPDWFSKRGDLIGAYAYAVMKDGSISQVILMNVDEIEEVKAVSKTAKKADSPWNKWPDRMFKKTVIRQLCKFVPTSAEYRREQLRDTMQVQSERDTPPQHMPLPALNDMPDLPRIIDNEDAIDAEVVDEQPNQPDAGDQKRHDTTENGAPATAQQEPVDNQPNNIPDNGNAAAPKANKSQLTKLHALLGKAKVAEDARLETVAMLADRAGLASTADLTADEISQTINALERCANDSDPANALDAVLAQLHDDRSGRDG